MRKEEFYRQELVGLADWDAYLLENSRLPGRRANIELARAVADQGDELLFKRYLEYKLDVAPTGSPYEFLAFCGVLGLGRLLAEGDRSVLVYLREFARDPRWRLREAVAMALQHWGEVDIQSLLAEMQIWSRGGPLEQRAAAAALCEPRLLADQDQADQLFQILDQITMGLSEVEDRRNQDYKTLRKGLGYCWSVAVAAFPDTGKLRMEHWFDERR